MKRTLIPKSGVDRFGAVVGLLSATFTFITISNGDYWWSLLFVLGTVVMITIAYVFQDQIALSSSTGEYSAVIERIEAIGKQLSELSEFLEKERARVADTEATIRQLKDEQTKLEPLVHTQREVVEAILSAHSERTVRYAWKERLVGFVLGMIASLIASLVYGYFKR
jgi:hypothetical protein